MRPLSTLLTRNTLKNSLMSTGAFEVMFDDQVLWSKLATGQMPRSEVDVVSALEAVLGKQD